MRARRLSFLAAVALVSAACVGSVAPTPRPVTDRPSGTAPPPAARATPASTRAPATPEPTRSPRPATGFFFRSDEIVAYYEEGVGFTCERWTAAPTPGHSMRACRLADATNPPADQVLTLTIDATGSLADILARYRHRDGSAVDHVAAMRFFATVIGASFGGDDGELAAQWLTTHLGVPATLDLRGLRFGTFLSDVPEERGSTLLIEVATPAFGDAAS